MQIIENNPDRVILVDDMGVGDRIYWGGLVVVGSVLAAAGFFSVFSDTTNLLAPGWAEANGLSHPGWETGEGRELPRALSMVVSIAFLCFSLFVLRGALIELLLCGSRRLIIDFGSHRATLFRRGVFRLHQQSLALPTLTASILQSDESERGMVERLSLSVVPGSSKAVPLRRWWSTWPRDPRGLSKTQVSELEWLTRVLPAEGAAVAFTSRVSAPSA